MSAKKIVTWPEFQKHLKEVDLLEPMVRICRNHHITLEGAFSPSRYKNVVFARVACWAYLREMGKSYTEIANMWGRDHTTVMGCLKRKRVT